MPRLVLALAFGGLALLPSAAVAKPRVCSAKVIQQALIDAGKLTREDVGFGVVVDRVRCGDVTDDGDTDALFTLASGGTAGDTRFGVLRGRADGSPGALVLYRQGYKIGVARRSRRAFEVLQPHYRSGDANCCPSSFRMRRYTWTGTPSRPARRRSSRRHRRASTGVDRAAELETRAVAVAPEYARRDGDVAQWAPSVEPPTRASGGVRTVPTLDRW